MSKTKTNSILGTKVTFTSRDDVPIGTMDFSDMATLLELETINAVCQLFRQRFNEMGEPLDYTIEYVSRTCDMSNPTREEWMADGTKYCCYCGMEKVRFSCCGEVDFQTFAEMSREEQQEFLDNEEAEQ